MFKHALRQGLAPGSLQSMAADPCARRGRRPAEREACPSVRRARGYLSVDLRSARRRCEAAAVAAVVRCCCWCYWCVSSKRSSIHHAGFSGWWLPTYACRCRRCRLGSSVSGHADEAVYLPTGALKLFRTLHAARPNHILLANDFDSLPDVRIPGRHAPLIAETVCALCRRNRFLD